jgi:predicted nucleic acid-binding protein
MIFLDTSAIYAWSDRADPRHEEAKARLRSLLEQGEVLLTHNYVLLEAMALAQHRLGRPAALAIADDAAAFEVEWVDASLHAAAADRLRRVSRRGVSLVDHVSFLVMRRRGVSVAFAFDPDFETGGFQLYRP